VHTIAKPYSVTRIHRRRIGRCFLRETGSLKFIHTSTIRQQKFVYIVDVVVDLIRTLQTVNRSRWYPPHLYPVRSANQVGFCQQWHCPLQSSAFHADTLDDRMSSYFCMSQCRPSFNLSKFPFRVQPELTTGSARCMF